MKTNIIDDYSVRIEAAKILERYIDQQIARAFALPHLIIVPTIYTDHTPNIADVRITEAKNK